MDQGTSSKPKTYFCSCNSVSLTEDQLQDHLSLPLNHKIAQMKQKNPPSLKFKKSISGRIYAILEAQTRIQNISTNLIQAIIQNTSIALENLDRLIRVYKDLLSDPHENLEIEKKEIFSDLKIDLLLSTALKSHFQQKSVAQRSSLNTIKQKIKNNVNQVLNDYVGSIQCMEIFKNERHVLTGGLDGAIRFWDLKTKSQVWLCIKHKSCVMSIAIGSDGENLLSGSQDMTVRLWSASFRKQLCVFKGHAEGVNSVLFSHDIRRALSGSYDGTIKVWSIERKTVERTIDIGFNITQICLIDRENTVAAAGLAGGKGVVAFYNFKKQTLKNTEPHRNFPILCICFNQDEKHFITGNEKGIVEIWRTMNLQKINELKNHKDWITKIEVSPCGKFFATVSRDFSVVICDFHTKSTFKRLKLRLTGKSLHYFGKSNVLLILTEGFELYNLSTYVNNPIIRTKNLNNIAISRDFKFMAYGLTELTLLDLESNNQVGNRGHLKRDILYLVFSKNCDSLVAGYAFGEISIFEVPDLVETQKLYSNFVDIECIDLSASKKFIAFTDDETKMLIQSVETKKVSFEEQGMVSSLSFCCNDNRFIYIQDSIKLQVLDKSFIKIASIPFSVRITEIFVSENDKNAILSYHKERWSIVNLSLLKKVFEGRETNVLKKWCARQGDFKARVYLSSLEIVSLN